jgi:TRAP-type mannitol/chloroaromatic compound transport system substrate-binding protein
MTERSPSRRRSIIKSAAVATAAISAPMVAVAQTTSFRFQSTWPAKDIFHEYANDFAKKVNDMAGGRLKIEVLPSGAVVPAFQLLEAVNKGTLDGGHGVLAYHYGKSPALALWGSGPAYGMDPNMVPCLKKFTNPSAWTLFPMSTAQCQLSLWVGLKSLSLKSAISKA